MSKYISGPFDKYYKPDNYGHYDRVALSNDVVDIAVKFWKYKGVKDKDQLVDKVEKLRKAMSKWKTSQIIIVGNKYYNVLSKNFTESRIAN